MELFSGLLLTVVVIAILAYVARELIAEDSGGAIGKHPGDSSAPAAAVPMLGKRGTVVGSGGERLRVRIEGERWTANPAEGAVLPAGTPIRVVAVKGLVLEVEPVAGEEDPLEGAVTT